MENTPEDIIHETAEKVCKKFPRLMLMPYEQMRAVALDLANEVIELRNKVAVAHGPQEG